VQSDQRYSVYLYFFGSNACIGYFRSIKDIYPAYNSLYIAHILLSGIFVAACIFHLGMIYNLYIVPSNRLGHMIGHHTAALTSTLHGLGRFFALSTGELYYFGSAQGNQLHAFGRRKQPFVYAQPYTQANRTACIRFSETDILLFATIYLFSIYTNKITELNSFGCLLLIRSAWTSFRTLYFGPDTSGFQKRGQRNFWNSLFHTRRTVEKFVQPMTCSEAETLEPNLYAECMLSKDAFRALWLPVFASHHISYPS
jgi:hypothetical protein